MIICLLGTRAQLIKMAPILKRLEQREIPFKLILTGQHKATMLEILTEFGITTRPDYVYRGNEISGLISMAWWVPFIFWQLWKRRNEWLGDRKAITIILIHGDTFSTLIGALFGRLTGCKVGHIESGLRSFNLLHPFPEEMTRLLCFRLSDIAFCPSEWAFQNLCNYNIERIDTGANTLLDAVRFAITASEQIKPTVNTPYCVVSIHRFENIFFKRRLRHIIDFIEKLSKEFEVVFVLHPATIKRLESIGLRRRLEQSKTIQLLPRMTYIPFIQLINDSKFVVTDGGSNQEELSYLKKPTLIMRNVTERREGLGEHAFLYNFDIDIGNSFLESIRHRLDAEAALDRDVRPSDIIIDHLYAKGFVET